MQSPVLAIALFTADVNHFNSVKFNKILHKMCGHWAKLFLNIIHFIQRT